MDLTAERKGFESLGAIYPAHSHVTIKPEVLAGTTVYRFTPPEVGSRETIVYFHGGAYHLGSIRSHQALVSHISAATGRVVLFVEYSLAPENRFPVALNEATAIVRHLATTGVPFALMGDSAGGNLAMSTALNLRQLNLPPALYHILLSPWLSMHTTAASYTENESKDPILKKETLQDSALQYTDANNLNNPLVSPLFGNFAGFTPTLSLTGKQEILRDDAVGLHQALEKAGCLSSLHVFDNVTHVWPLTNITSAESVEALRLVRSFADAPIAMA